MMNEFWPGTRVIVFDPRLFVDDVATPLSHTMRPATVEHWYGRRSSFGWTDGELIAVRFDHRAESISYGHFTDGVAMEVGR